MRCGVEALQFDDLADPERSASTVSAEVRPVASARGGGLLLVPCTSASWSMKSGGTHWPGRTMSRASAEVPTAAATRGVVAQ